MIKDNFAEHLNEVGGKIVSRSASPVMLVAKPTDRNEDEQTKHHFASILSAVRRGWLFAVPSGICLSLVCAFAAWTIFLPKFSASAFLRIDSDNRPLIFKTADESSGRDFKLYKNTNQQLLVTPFVLSSALRDPQLSSLAEITSQEDAIGWLQANLKVSFPGDSEIMQVSAQTASPAGCVQIVNGVVNAFMQEVVMNERNDRLNRLNSLQIVHSEAEIKVRNKRGELKSLAAAMGTSDSQSLSVAQQSVLTQYGRMAEKLGEVQFSLMQAEGELKIAEDFDRRQKEAKSQLEPTDNSRSMPLADERTADVIQLEEDIAVSKAKLTSLLKELGRRHPTVVNAIEEIEVKNKLLALRKAEAIRRSKLANERALSGSSVPGSSSPGLSTPGVFDLVALFTRKQVISNQEKIIREKVDKLSEETRQLGRSSIDVELMRSEISGLEDVLRRVGEEIERTSIELKTSSRIRKLSEAVSASRPDSSKRLTLTLVLGVFGLIAPFGLLIIWDLSRKRVNDGEGTSHSLSLPTIGTIPMVGRNALRLRSQVPLIEGDRTRAVLDEALDGLSSMIIHSFQTHKRQVFMISSALSGEGKSTLACQLALGLARAGKSVALVDFDLRRPSLHRYMELSLEPGVSEALFGNVSFDEACQKTDLANLSVITAGNWNGNLHERCTSGKVEELFDFLRSSFDLVIIDSSPVLPVHDSRVIGKFTDGVILTLIRDRSRLPDAAQAFEILTSYGIPVLGTVIIGVSSHAYSGYYPRPSKDREPKRLVDVN